MCLGVLLIAVSWAGHAVGKSKRCCEQLVDGAEQFLEVQNNSLGCFEVNAFDACQLSTNLVAVLNLSPHRENPHLG